MPTPEALARAAAREAPAPERFAELDAQTQRVIRRAATEAETSPEQLWAGSRASAIAAADTSDEAARIAAAVRS